MKQFFYIIAGLLTMLVVVLVVTASWTYYREKNSPSFDPNTIELHTKRFGSGKQKLILLHGLMGSMRYWGVSLDEISSQYDILMIDLLGFGESPKPNGKYDLNEHLIALERTILKAEFNQDDAILVGHSLGSILSLALLSRNPSWFKGAALIAYPIYKNSKDAEETIFNASGLHKFLNPDNPITAFVCYLHPLFQAKWLASVFDIPDNIYVDATKHTLESVEKTYEEIILNSTLESFDFVETPKPVLFIHGQNDLIAPLENVEKIASRLQDTKLVTVADEHHLFLSQTNLVWSEIREFFR